MSSENKDKPKIHFSDFLKKNKGKLLSIFIIIILGLLILIGLNEYNKRKNIKISQDFNKAKIFIKAKNNDQALRILDEIIFKKNKFYSPSSLNLVIDNELVKNKDKILLYFDEIISNSKLDQDTKNLFIFKKIIFIGDEISENVLLSNLKPLIQSNSIWKNSVSDYIKQYYLSKNEFKKAKEFDKSLK